LYSGNWLILVNCTSHGFKILIEEKDLGSHLKTKNSLDTQVGQLYKDTPLSSLQQQQPN
jgi:hypothetical protein